MVLDKGLIMHETLSSNFKGFIDNFYHEDGNLRISGWLITNHKRDDVVYFIDIGHNVAFYNHNEREDVADFYNMQTDDYKRCGFDISIPQKDIPEINLFALVRGQKEAIFNLKTSESRAIPQSQLVGETHDIKINTNTIPSVIVIDNFYSEPDKVREMALQQTYNPDIRYHKGQRTTKKFIAEGTKQLFESYIGRKITRWVEYEYNGIFQFCTAEDPLVYHSDTQNFAAAVYLTPDAPVTTGTSFFRSKKYPDIRKTNVDAANYSDIFEGGFYDKTKFELIDTVGNVYNRCVIWDAKLIHSASEYFGTNKENGRLFHLFFFDIEE